MNKVLMIDPEGGWKYGFPKVVPEDVINREEVLEWLWDNGYPRGKKPHYCRYFEVDDANSLRP